jgi:XrtN system VIT domain protein
MSRFPLKDGVYLTGLFLIIVATILFVLRIRVDESSWFFGIFILFYSISMLYIGILTVSGFIRFGWRLARNNVSYTFLLLVLFLISAYALNRMIPVFQQATDWFSGYIVLACFACIALSFRDFLPTAANYAVYFLAGLAFTLFAYLAIYVFPYYMISVMGLLFFGISIHTYIPALFVIYLLIVFTRAYRQDAQLLKPVLAGVLLPVLIAAYFTIQWTAIAKKITFSQNWTGAGKP